MSDWSPKCAYCGRFAGWRAERFTPFGGSQDLEPPDEEFVCRRCARRLYRDAIRERRIPSHWHSAAWTYRAAKKLGFVQAGPHGAAWVQWFARDSLPAGYEVVGSERGETP